jgi:hypothetical protein
VHEFRGRFRDGVRDGRLNVSFDHRFDFLGEPCDARVTMYYSTYSSTVWVFVQEKTRSAFTAMSLSGSSMLQ